METLPRARRSLLRAADDLIWSLLSSCIGHWSEKSARCLKAPGNPELAPNISHRYSHGTNCWHPKKQHVLVKRAIVLRERNWILPTSLPPAGWCSHPIHTLCQNCIWPRFHSWDRSYQARVQQVMKSHAFRSGERCCINVRGRGGDQSTSCRHNLSDLLLIASLGRKIAKFYLMIPGDFVISPSLKRIDCGTFTFHFRCWE